jgi:hypothetical protein
MDNSIALLNSRVYLIEKKLEYLTTLIVTWTNLTKLDTTSKPAETIEINVNNEEDNNYVEVNNENVVVGNEEMNFSVVDKQPIMVVVNKCSTSVPSKNLFDDKRNWYLRRVI